MNIHFMIFIGYLLLYLWYTLQKKLKRKTKWFVFRFKTDILVPMPIVTDVSTLTSARTELKFELWLD